MLPVMTRNGKIEKRWGQKTCPSPIATKRKICERAKPLNRIRPQASVRSRPKPSPKSSLHHTPHRAQSLVAKGRRSPHKMSHIQHEGRGATSSSQEPTHKKRRLGDPSEKPDPVTSSKEEQEVLLLLTPKARKTSKMPLFLPDPDSPEPRFETLSDLGPSSWRLVLACHSSSDEFWGHVRTKPSETMRSPSLRPRTSVLTKALRSSRSATAVGRDGLKRKERQEHDSE